MFPFPTEPLEFLVWLAAPASAGVIVSLLYERAGWFQALASEAKAQTLFKAHGGVEVIFLNKRVNFKMPNMGFAGGGAWFPVAWFTHGLGIGQPMTFATLNPNG